MTVPERRLESMDAESVLGGLGPFRRDGLGYVFEPPGAEGITLRVEYLVQRGSDIESELTATSRRPGTAAHLLRRQINLLGGTRFDSVLKELERKVALGNDGWRGILESFCESVIRDRRRGEPFLKPSQIELRPARPDLVEQVIMDGVPNHLFGHSKVGKGWLAVGMSAAVAFGVPFAGLQTRPRHVTYLDWEDRPEIWKGRLVAVCRGLGLEPTAADLDERLSYRRMRAPLHQDIHQIASHVDGTSTGLLVVDSFEMAAGSMGERMSHEDIAKRLFEALALVGEIGSLLIDHISGEESRERGGPSKAINSIMKRAWVRNSWKVVKAQESGAHISEVGLYHDDTNHGQKHAPIGVAIDFSEAGVVRFTRNDMARVPEFLRIGAGTDRVLGALRYEGRPLTRTELRDLTGLSADEVRTYTSRLSDRGRLVKVGEQSFTLPRNAGREYEAADAVARPFRVVSSPGEDEDHDEWSQHAPL